LRKRARLGRGSSGRPFAGRVLARLAHDGHQRLALSNLFPLTSDCSFRARGQSLQRGRAGAPKPEYPIIETGHRLRQLRALANHAATSAAEPHALGQFPRAWRVAFFCSPLTQIIRLSDQGEPTFAAYDDVLHTA